MMNDRPKLIENMSYSVERPRNLATLLESQGIFQGQLLRRKRKQRGGYYHDIIQEVIFHNLVTNVGKGYMLDSTFNASTQLSSWYLGLISGATTPTLSASDTSASHTGWSEFLSYNESVRQTWGQTASSGNTVTASAASVFTIGTVAANTYVNGGFLISNNTKAGTTGTLWSEGLFTNPVPVQTTDIFKLGYLTGL